MALDKATRSLDPIKGVRAASVYGLMETFISPGAHCLEVGSGSSHSVIVNWLAQRGCSCLSINWSLASSLPFADGSFDAVLMVDELEHLRAPRNCITMEMCRVLRPGGVLLVTGVNISYWRCRLRVAAGGQLPQGGTSIRSLRGLLLDGGFNLVGVEGQDGAFVRDLPLAGRLWRGQSSRPYRLAERLWPSLFGSRVGAFAIKVN